jgi:NitT/TauT family transport system ATP-binding protein/nitrate/nitrite transport system substrate-binding protein
MTGTIRVGLLRLCDAAPVLLAAETGVFARHGCEVAISVEPSWANIADKLSYGLLDGAVMLPPLALACARGLRGPKTALVVPMSLSAAGNSIAFANAWHPALADGPAGLAAALASRAERPRLAVVHGFSTHDLLLRYWLAALGIDPDRDVDITVLPPAETVSAMAAGRIDGFCAGAPWGQAAEAAGIGFIAVNSGQIWRDHPEKCLALRADFAADHAETTIRLVVALLEACALCAAITQRDALADLLARPDYLDLPRALIAASLNPATGGPVFALNEPSPTHGAWFAAQMIRWGKAPPAIADEVTFLYRPDLYRAAGGKVSVPHQELFMDALK